MIDLEDAVISGTDDSFSQMDQVISQYQVRADVNKFRADTYESCKNSSLCAPYIETNFANVFNMVN